MNATTIIGISPKKFGNNEILAFSFDLLDTPKNGG